MIKIYSCIIFVGLILYGCASPEEKQRRLKQHEIYVGKIDKFRNELCGNVESLTKGMTWNEVVDRIGHYPPFDFDRYYGYTGLDRPEIYVACKRNTRPTYIDYAGYTLAFSEGCIFDYYRKPKYVYHFVCVEKGLLSPAELLPN